MARIMTDDFENTVRLTPSKTFTPKPVERRDVFMHIKGPGAPQTIVIEPGDRTIGRSTEADLRFLSSRVSRKHARLFTKDNDTYCMDLGSHNGLLLNGILVHSVALRDGDTLQIGDIVLIYHQGVQWASM